MAKKLIMIRHGALDIQYSSVFMGKTDVSLSGAGRKQAAALSGPLSSLRAVHFIVSPLQRALETAQLALAATGQSFDVDSDLREIDFGFWEGKTFAEISMLSPSDVQRWSNFDNDFVFPGGETISSFMQRVRELAQRIAADPAENVVVITHGGIIRFLICYYLGLDIRHYLLFDVQPASLSVITLYDGKGILNRLNDLCHLEGSDCG
ncbi:MAG: histidine phosphatase family protein [Smithellaceae bacterium]